MKISSAAGMLAMIAVLFIMALGYAMAQRENGRLATLRFAWVSFWIATIGVLMAAGMFAYFFLSALYLQGILGYTPLEVGLAYLPSMVMHLAWSTGSFISKT